MLRNKESLKQLDEEHRELWLELAKTAVLDGGTKKPHDVINDRIELMNIIDKVTNSAKAAADRDVIEARKIALEQTADLILTYAEKVNPQLALTLKAAQGGTDATIILAGIAQNRIEALKVSTGLNRDLQNLQNLVAKDRSYRLNRVDTKIPTVPSHKPVTPPIKPVSPVDRTIAETEELNSWIEQGNRAFGATNSPAAQARANTFYEKYPILKQFQGVAEFRSPADEYDRAGGVALLTPPPTFNPANLSPQERAGWVGNQQKNRPPLVDGQYHSLDGGQTWLRNDGTANTSVKLKGNSGETTETVTVTAPLVRIPTQQNSERGGISLGAATDVGRTGTGLGANNGTAPHKNSR